MKFDIFGRGILEVMREGDNWVIYTLGEGKRSKSSDIVIPSHLDKNEVLVFLADIFHEVSTPEHPEVKLIE